MMMNASPSKIVMIRNVTRAFLLPICAARTASAMVKLLPISTAVLMAPMVTFSIWLPAAKPGM